MKLVELVAMLNSSTLSQISDFVPGTIGGGSSTMPAALRFAASSRSIARMASHFRRSFSAFSRASAD